MEALDRNYIIALYDLYGALLTEKQRSYFEDYYFMDLSIGEIALNYSISRNGVYDQVKRSVLALEDYEGKLGLHKKLLEIEKLNIAKDLKEAIFNILMEE